MAAEEMTIEDLMKIFFEGAQESGAHGQLPLKPSSRE
jgi:hypothetical protein